MKKALKSLLIVFLVILVVVLSYLAYVFISYHRIDDNQSLDINIGETSAQNFKVNKENLVPIGKKLSVTSYNIGFGAYTRDFSFFMDGGKYSRAFSEDSVKKTIQGINDFTVNNKADFYLFQEIDKDSTRAQHVDEVSLVKQNPVTKDYYNTFAVNYDSPYLFYPITSPHGKSLSGLLTLSKYNINSSVRRQLPIQTDLAKILDLDRCYSVNKLPTANGKYLCLYNVHLSAYTTDSSIGNKQLDVLYKDIQNEYKSGNYVVVGGDFNKDLLGNSSKIWGIQGDYSWNKPFQKDKLPKNFKLVAPCDDKNPIPSCRNANEPYNPKTTFVLTVDGFIVSKNIEVKDSKVYNLNFEYSDHNPVNMNFSLSK